MTHQRYAEFYQRNANGELVPALGTDSRLPLDGRWGAATIERAARKHKHSLRNLKWYSGYIVRGRTGQPHSLYISLESNT